MPREPQARPDQRSMAGPDTIGGALDTAVAQGIPHPAPAQRLPPPLPLVRELAMLQDAALDQAEPYAPYPAEPWPASFAN
jgi:hypothetical protein